MNGSGRRLLGALVLAALLAAAVPGVAQEDGAGIWRRGGCANCHGGLAQGGAIAGEPGSPEGPNLRKTNLDRDEIRETVACGRGEMPSHLKGAYREVSCYGLPAGAPLPTGYETGAQFTAAELDVLVDFLVGNVVGVTPIDREACAVFFGGEVNLVCAQYPR